MTEPPIQAIGVRSGEDVKTDRRTLTDLFTQAREVQLLLSGLGCIEQAQHSTRTAIAFQGLYRPSEGSQKDILSIRLHLL